MKLKELYAKTPAPVRSFIIKALVVFIAWFYLYQTVLLPQRTPDLWLTNTTCTSTAQFLSLFYHNVGTIPIVDKSEYMAIITINNAKIIGIADACNALDIFVLYLGFIFCFPGTALRKIAFMALGIPYIYIINIIRCAAIAWLNIYHRGWVELSHHYIFTIIVYGLVFYLWILYSKKSPKKNAS